MCRTCGIFCSIHRCEGCMMCSIPMAPQCRSTRDVIVGQSHSCHLLPCTCLGVHSLRVSARRTYPTLGPTVRLSHAVRPTMHRPHQRAASTEVQSPPGWRPTAVLASGRESRSAVPGTGVACCTASIRARMVRATQHVSRPRRACS